MVIGAPPRVARSFFHSSFTFHPAIRTREPAPPEPLADAGSRYRRTVSFAKVPEEKRAGQVRAMRLRSLGWTSLSPAPALPGRMTAPSLRTVYRGSLPVTRETSAGGSGRAAGLVRETSCSLLPARRGVSRIKAWIPRASSVRYAGKSLLRLHREGDNFQLSREPGPPPSLKRRARINRINGLDG